jgi:hypothetical protein
MSEPEPGVIDSAVRLRWQRRPAPGPAEAGSIRRTPRVLSDVLHGSA